MAGVRFSLLSRAVLCLIFLCHGCLAQLYPQQPLFGGGGRQFGDQSQCRLQSLHAQEPSRRIESEAGVTEYWNASDEQFECAGVAAVRQIVQPRSLVLPEFSNAPRLVYIVQGHAWFFFFQLLSSLSLPPSHVLCLRIGSGIYGVVMPGCPETFHSFEPSHQEFREERPGQQRFRDQHQKIRHFRRGDIIALPAGFSHWCYNSGDQPVITVTILDASNYANQLGRKPSKFFLAGSQLREGWQGKRVQGQEEGSAGNIFSGFDDQILAEALGVSREVARKLKSQDDRRGSIVRVEGGLQVVGPGMEHREEHWEEQEGAVEEREREDERRRKGRRGEKADINGLEETLCSMKLRENIGDPVTADFYSRQAGHITTLNSQKLRILKYLQLNAERGHLRRNAIVGPLWNINAHSLIYCTRGTARIQIVGTGQRLLFNGQLSHGQILVVPQGHAMVKQAQEEFEWVAFKTNDYAMVSPLTGRTSVLRGLPEDVLVNAFRLSREEARRLKFARDSETLVLSPGRPHEIKIVSE
ncbi:hypothetical protein Taro_056290 [Colocasia esculenta]|uniref:Cupin type-1 domain-containing protein n=1 Tax=Colocasia esculenta TaxID=4460 RepID=A0A843XWW4_COLES|nr:hypothetical protein [Colocasia esculenta]